LPEVRVEAAGLLPGQVTRWLALAGSELLAEAPAGLQPVADPARTLHAWPGEADRLRRRGGQAWRVLSDDWRLRLRPRYPVAEATPVRVLLAEHVAAVIDGRRWVHQATYQLVHEAGSDLRLVLPAGAAPVLAVTIDGTDVIPLQPAPDRLWLPLPGRAGARTVRLRWTFDPGEEPLDQPNLEQPRLEGIPEGAVLWTVHVPAGFRLDQEERRQPGLALPASAAGQELRRAAALLRLIELLGPRARDSGDTNSNAQMLAARDHFQHCCRRAEYLLALPSRTTPDTGPAGRPLSEWLVELREQAAQLARAYEGEKLPTEDGASRGPRSLEEDEKARTLSAHASALPQEPGLPYYWYGAPGAVPPRLHLIAWQQSRTRQSWVLSALLIVVLLAMWGLTRLPVATWPEQLVLLGGLGWLTFGPVWGMSFALLPLIWVGVRLGSLGHWALAMWRRQTPATAAPGE
jgi:hypothetical protein